MVIRDIFAREIDRDLKAVIKVGQAQEENIQQELEEYVVTDELRRYFTDFFSNYSRGIYGNTDKMGVWISGFFGSGKSHFLKMISYILENKVVGGKRAIDYFDGGEKTLDTATLGNMRLAASTPTTVILFNVDSKSESAGKQSRDPIVSVFLKAFNEKLGFCGAYPNIADLERRLTDVGKYAQFKEKFRELNGGDWLRERYSFDFVSDDVVDAMSGIGFMSAEAARSWCDKATDPYNISIERFAGMIREYIEKQGHNHHVAFMVDEIGQYIGDDSKLMLNLQTMTEDLGTACLGKAWVVVTSQQDIDSITHVKGNDFSKIQGRFDTRISLTAANVDEVIRERILKKKETAKSTLSVLYEEKSTTIRNKIRFEDEVEMKLYSGKSDFADVYPFVPYQFNLLGNVLTQLRLHSSSNTAMSDEARSMLKLFKESGMQVEDREIGALVPFSLFYNAIKNSVDPAHVSVIAHAMQNGILNPNREEWCLSVEILKVLFLLKYVTNFKTSAENITSLMVGAIDEDRMALRAEVDAALDRLVRQTLIQKNGDVYVFLTNEERETNLEISRQHVDPSEITAKISEMIFDGIFDVKKYRHPAFGGRYSYGFNQIVDGRPYRPTLHFPMTLKIVTPESDEFTDPSAMRLYTERESCVLVVLPGNTDFVREFRTAIQTGKFLQKGTSASRLANYDEIKTRKNREITELTARGRLYLEDALEQADIYVNGDIFHPAAKDVTGRLNEALGRLVSTVYHKLSYIDRPVGETDIRAALKTGPQQIKLDGVSAGANSLALSEAAAYIGDNTAKHTRTSMKTLTDRFMAPPYGFVEADVQWIAATLFKDNTIALTVNSEPVTSVTRTEDEIFRFITRKEYLERLLMERKKSISAGQKKLARDLMNSLFGVNPSSDDQDALMDSFKKHAESLNRTFNDLDNSYYLRNSAYPGRPVIQEGRKQMADIAQLTYTNEFFAHLANRKDDLFDLAEDFEPIRSFFGGGQLKIFDRALQYMSIYEDSKTFIVDADVEAAVRDIGRILRDPRPFGQIHKLPALLDNFMKAYSAVLNQMTGPARDAIDDAWKRVYDRLEGRPFRDKFADSFRARFDELTDKLTHCNNVAALQNIKVEADALKLRCLNAIDAEEARLAPPPAPVDEKTPPAPPKPVKVKRSISIKSVNTQQTWRLETPEDVRRYVGELERRLLAELRDGAVIDLEF